MRVTQQANPLFDAARNESRLPESYLKSDVPVAGAAVTGASSSAAASGAASDAQPTAKRQRA